VRITDHNILCLRSYLYSPFNRNGCPETPGIRSKIIYLRKNYHFGPQKISMYLKRYEKPLPGHRVQVDVKFIEPIAGLKKRHCQYTAVDDCTRIRVLRIYPKNDQRTATQFLYYLLVRLPFKVEVIQTDNGAEFQGSFHYHVLDKGVGHVYIKPASPRLNGKEVVTRTEFP